MTQAVAVLSSNFGRPANTTAYAVNDAVSDSVQWMTFSSAAFSNGGSGTILTAQLLQDAYQSTLGSFDLLLFHTVPAIQTDNGQIAFTDAEMQNCVGVIPFISSYASNVGSGAAGNVIWVARNVNLDYVCAAADSALYGAVVVRNAYTPVSQERFYAYLKVRRM